MKTGQAESSLLFLGDLKGTQSSLASFSTGGKEQLAHRVATLHAAFGKAFLSFADRSLSLRAITLSDSVIAEWNDIAEGVRFAGFFADAIWQELGDMASIFRGFIDCGPIIVETDPVLIALDGVHSRFTRVIPVGVAIWSTSLAEKAHFPPGIFVGCGVADRLVSVKYDPDIYKADTFEYKKIRVVTG